MWAGYFPGVDFERDGGVGVGTGGSIALFDTAVETGIDCSLCC